MKETTKTSLKMYFRNGDNRNVTETITNYPEDVTLEEVRSIMETFVALDKPNDDGLRRYAQVVGAKFVTVTTTVIFDDSANLPKPTSKPRPKPKPEDTDTPQRPVKTEVRLAGMLRQKPTTTAKILYNDVLVHGESPESIERYICNALKTQCIGRLLPEGKKIDPYVFYPNMKKYFEKVDWTPELIAHLQDVKVFFPAPEWYEVIKHFKKHGRSQAAVFFGEEEHPNYAKANQFTAELFDEASFGLVEYRKAEGDLAQGMLRLVS